jgi:PAS domain S-box-containing protein
LRYQEKRLTAPITPGFQYARSLIEAILDPFITINPEGNITDMNEALVQTTGQSREFLKDSHFSIYFTDPEKAQSMFHQLFEIGFLTDFPLVLKDHKLMDVLINGSIYKNGMGVIMGAVLVARDITILKQTEKNLNEAKVFAEIATAIAEEAKLKAEQATHIAEGAVRAKQQFLSNMSHEIRTPMNAIIGFTKVVLKTELTAKQNEYLNAIKLSGDALIVLINDILDLAKVDSGKMIFEQEPFKLSNSISSMLHLFKTKVQEKNILLIQEYDNNIPEILLGDSVRLHQIILNLVSNAVKFTNEGEIRMRTQLIKEDAEKVSLEFSVTDTGIGIPENRIGTIFENFQQATNGTSRLYGGTGLGLAIVKQLVERQGGKIEVSSKTGEGSRFSFILNFLRTDAKPKNEIEHITYKADTKKIKILVVEDIPLNQLLMRTVLDDYGFESDIAANGKIAIDMLKEKEYNIILMDLQMPVMNGFEATSYIRNTIKSTIPIIALTADVTTVDLEKCTTVGINDYVAKPIDEHILYNKILRHVKQSSTLTATPNTPQNALVFKYTDLKYLTQKTKSDPKLMMEMISLYLEQIPSLISIMKQSLLDKDWKTLYGAAHKIIPSFSIMGMSVDTENIAKIVQQHAKLQQEEPEIQRLVLQLEGICIQSCLELQLELVILQKLKK